MLITVQHGKGHALIGRPHQIRQGVAHRQPCIAGPRPGIGKGGALSSRQQIGMIHHAIGADGDFRNHLLHVVVYAHSRRFGVGTHFCADGVEHPLQIRSARQGGHQTQPTALHHMGHRHARPDIVLQRLIDDHFMQRGSSNDGAALAILHHTAAQGTGGHIHRARGDQHVLGQPQLPGQLRTNGKGVFLGGQYRRIFIPVLRQAANLKGLLGVLTGLLVQENQRLVRGVGGNLTGQLVEQIVLQVHQVFGAVQILLGIALHPLDNTVLVAGKNPGAGLFKQPVAGAVGHPLVHNLAGPAIAEAAAVADGLHMLVQHPKPVSLGRDADSHHLGEVEPVCQIPDAGLGLAPDFQHVLLILVFLRENTGQRIGLFPQFVSLQVKEHRFNAGGSGIKADKPFFFHFKAPLL